MIWMPLAPDPTVVALAGRAAWERVEAQGRKAVTPETPARTPRPALAAAVERGRAATSGQAAARRADVLPWAETAETE
jgi:hypothetical protein